METKTCSKCKIKKDKSEFTRRSDRKNSLFSECKSCNNKRSKEYKARMLESNPEQFKIREKANRLKSVYGINPDEYKVIYKSQDGRCAICKKKDKLVVDHDHATKKIRGLLCHHCNLVLGHSKDTVQILKNAIEYLQQ
jgi:hypothetical protein